MIAVETVTVWHRRAEGIDRAGWERETLPGCCKLELSGGARASNPQAQVEDAATLYSFADSPIAPGDMVCAGERMEDEPPACALRAAKVARKALSGCFHHLEVSCR